MSRRVFAGQRTMFDIDKAEIKFADEVWFNSGVKEVS